MRTSKSSFSSMLTSTLTSSLKFAAFILAVTLFCASGAVAQTEHVVYSFAGYSLGGTDAQDPESGVTTDAAGNIYGTTTYGGANNCGFTIPGCGTVYKINAPTTTGGVWTESVIYNFTGGSDGFFPSAGVSVDSAGNVYGSSLYSNGGLVFKLTPPSLPGGAWTETTLHTLAATNYVQGPFAIDSSGNLFGTSSSSNNDGSIFELSPPATSGGEWAYQTIYTFKGQGDGSLPAGPLLLTKSGAIYGTTAYGGLVANCRGIGCGVVFRLLPPTSSGGHWTEGVIYSFAGMPDGQFPFLSGVTMDKSGNLYGTTFNGGTSGDGTVFELSPPATKGGTWSETVLHSFNRQTEGYLPQNNIVIDHTGNLFGTTIYAAAGDGAVFKLAPPITTGGIWTESLYNFTNGNDGGYPQNLALAGKFNWLYGATSTGGKGTCACGTVFKIIP